MNQARAKGWPGRVVVADSGYGVSGPFSRELEARGLSYVVGVTEQMIERRDDGTLRYAFSNLPATTSRLRAVRYWRRRWPVEQGYQQMKEELGLDHFEGRSWHGFHRTRSW